MAKKAPKRYYWLKLKEDFFEDDTIKFLREQPNGNEYCICYLILCCKALRTNGRLVRIIGNTLIPYDIKALALLTGCLEDTVKGMLGLLRQIGVIEVNESGEIFLQQLSEMVGSESQWAEYARKRRLLDKAESKVIEADIQKIEKSTNVVKNTLFCESSPEEKSKNWTLSNECPTYKEKDKEKDKEKELNKEKKISKKKSQKFVKPSVQEVQTYCEERKNQVDAEAFIDFYESKGWAVGKSPMKDWKAAVRTWEKNSYGRQNNRQVVKGEILYEPKDGEDVAYQRMFNFWKQYVRISVPQTNEQVQACKELLEDVGEEGLQRLIVALAMRSKHSYLPAELTKIKDFIGLRNNAVVVQSFYDQHWQYWQQMQKAAQLGKEIWEV